jgi:rubrerythrin
MSTKEAQEKIVSNMKKWQKIEKASIVSTGRIMEGTENPIIGLVAEIIQRDSQMHKRVQELIQDSLETKAIALSPDELGAVWNLVEKHIEIEKDTIKLAKESLEAVGKNKGMTVQAYLLEYLLIDEEKHDAILSKLESIKKNMYPYG